MRRRILALVTVACASASIAYAQSGRPLPPVEAFGSLPFISDARLSPDGKYFAAIQELEGRPAVAVYQVNAPKGDFPRVYRDTNWIIAGISWAKNDRLLVFLKRLSEGGTTYSAMSVGTGAEEPIQLPGLFSEASIADRNLGDPDWVFIAGFAGLYRVNVRTGKFSEVMNSRRYTYQWLLDGRGNVVAHVDRLHLPRTDKLYLYKDGSWGSPIDFDAVGDGGAHAQGVSEDGKSVVLLTGGERDRLSLLDISSGEINRTLYENGRFDVEGAIRDEWTGRIVGAYYIGDKGEYTYFDPAREAVQQGIEAAFPGTEASIASSSREGDKMIIVSDTPKQPATYYFLDRTTHQASKIASKYPALRATDLGEVRALKYKARDGLEISAYLTIPPGRDVSNLPLVVMPHGGPDLRDSIGFDWWAQFLANRGYAVFQPNYRGSAGYGRAFTDAGLGQWGLKMQDDITDGVEKLIADGIANPKRICIVGGSYGGYAALAGATFTPDLYACAVSFAGVSDLERMLIWEGARYGDIKTSYASFWISRIGDVSKDADRIAATSPALHADRVKTPVLLMHGANDATVPIEQSEEERDALLRAGKSVEFVKFDTDDHYFSLAATRIGMLLRLEKFLHDHIGS